MKHSLLIAAAVAGLLLIALTPTLILHWHIQMDYQPEPEEPPIWPIPDDETAARKALFINMMLPAVQASNRELLTEREQVQGILERRERGTHVTKSEYTWLAEQASRYRLSVPEESEDITAGWLNTLLRRVDIVPADLALAQGALESAWGTSRFAEEANNYFGQWCFSPGCGVVPARRPLGARYEVQRFDSLDAAVSSYMRNLNSHPAYRELRALRERQRHEGASPSGHVMAAGLSLYAEIGDTYIDHIRSVIRVNNLNEFADY
ncbi:glucosaminidase domain-containing protein [Alcanivorax sp. JB21]|uniref:glucosaminidase domain-containing protein n=1 Tax=Alcanivorax limicola TaxID=2874102 RepID=UPI001CBFEDF2|nr:glucosaminidase domain-containing protein [Alcanivorax limicola]MBZ2189309.1 glucosaminidase domain-containing protein [Alcanivorax limicola]